MKMSKAANYMLGVSGAIVVGIWAIASLGEDDANGVPQAAAPVVPESVAAPAVEVKLEVPVRSEEHTSELQSLMRNSYAALCLQTNKNHIHDDLLYHSRTTHLTYNI